MPPFRFSGLPFHSEGGATVYVAATRRSRLLGLAWLRHPPRGCLLLIPGCRSVHTFGMAFPIDVLFLDGEARVIRAERSVPPGRVLVCRAAAAALEFPAE